MVATDSSRSSVRTRYAAPHPGPPPRLSVAVAGSVGFGGCVVSFDPWRLWLLCGYFATTFLSAPLRRGAGSAGRSRGSGVAVGCLVGVHDGCVQGLGGDAARRPRPPACGAARRRRPRPRAPVKSPVSWCGGVFAVFSRRVRGAGPATPWRFFGGTGSSGRPGPWDVVVALPAASLGVLHVRRWLDGSGARRVGALAAMVLLVRRAPGRPARRCGSGVIVLDAAVVVRVAGVGGVPRGVLVMGAVATVRWTVPESGTHDGQCGG